jgi:starch-binding outer membrane protein, SusD/RagB family
MNIIMRMNINKTITIIFAAAALASCKKEKLSPVPQTFLSDLVAFGSADRIAQQVTGVYASVKNGNLLGGRAIVYGDARGEDWLNVTNNGVTALQIWNHSVVSTDNQVEGLWSAGYAAINRANVVLKGIDDNPTVISSAQANLYRGEIRFLRALTYFHLTTMYSKNPYASDNGASLGVPLRLKANLASGDEALVRSTQNQVFAQILADLTFAEANLPLNNGGAENNVVRAHRNAAIALKTRVYLQMGDYPNVILEANKLVPTVAPFTASSGIAHTLNANFTNVFRSPYQALESIFSLPMNNTNAPGTQNGLSLYHNAEFSLNNVSGIVTDVNWKATDARKVLVTSANRYQKYNDDINNYVAIIRWAEVLLNTAEALARQGSAVDVRALAILNAVRQRSDATTTFAPATKADLINLILNERRIELLGEGHRMWDIQRQGLPFLAKGSAPSVAPTAQNYVWPIPASELLYNSACVPN